MNAAQRRERILTRLNSAGAPLSASTLAAELGVSRQIVVGDVALLRAGGAQIDATPRGYQLHPAEKGYTGILACVHRTQEEMRELIIHERRMELAFEGHRWFDLVRIDDGDYAIEFLQSIGKSVTRERLLLPIPQTEIDSNSAMTQNPGY